MYGVRVVREVEIVVGEWSVEGRGEMGVGFGLWWEPEGKEMKGRRRD